MIESALARSEEPKHFAPAEPIEVLAHVPPCESDDSPVVPGEFLWAGGEKLWIKGVTYGTFRPVEDGAECPLRRRSRAISPR